MNSDIRPQRYTDIPFPDKRYLPGEKMPHPKEYPDSSYIPYMDTLVAFGVESWRSSRRYLYAVDLFNYRYWWEAHEVLEDLWIEAGKQTPVGRFIQGLIQIAAALLKQSQSMHKGARRLAGNGLSKIRLQSGNFLGVDIDAFGKQVEAHVWGGIATVPAIRLAINGEQSGRRLSVPTRNT